MKEEKPIGPDHTLWPFIKNIPEEYWEEAIHGLDEYLKLVIEIYDEQQDKPGE